MFESKIEYEAMLEVPIYQTHKRGKNWMAVISISPTSPGGLGRKFIKRGNGPYYYMTTELKENDAIEFGADYYSSKGSKSTHRWYGVIRKLTSSMIQIEEYKSGRDAIKNIN